MSWKMVYNFLGKDDKHQEIKLLTLSTDSVTNVLAARIKSEL